MGNLYLLLFGFGGGLFACYLWSRKRIKRAESSIHAVVKANHAAHVEVGQLRFALNRAHAEMRKWQNAPSDIEAIVRGRMN